MTLFDDIIRQSLDPARHNENTYDFYNKSAKHNISIIRDLLNDWFVHYPKEEKSELKSRFLKDFDAAFHELYLYNLFNKLGFTITIHPEIANTLKRPDFLIVKDDFEAYVEAKVVKDKSQKQEALERMANEFYDGLSKAKIMNFLLGIEKLLFISGKQPSTKKLIKLIEAKVGEYNPEVITKLLTEKGYEYFPKIHYKDNDVVIVLKLMPVMLEAQNKIMDRPIGAFPTEVWWGGSEESIRDAITEKAKRYGTLDKPYLIAINALTEKITSSIDVNNAVLGSIALTWSEDPNNKDEKWIRQRDGVFLDTKGARLTNLSAVFITKVYPHNIPTASYWLYEHPFSTNKTMLDRLGLFYDSLKNGEFIGKQYNNLGQILQIPNDWTNLKNE